MINQTLEIEDQMMTNHSCTICMKEDLIDEDIYHTNCGHEFCRPCLDDWFQRGNNSCPLCRSKIDIYKYKSENYRLVIHEINNGINNEEDLTQININNPLILRRIMDTNIIFRGLVKQNAKLRIFLFLTMAGFLFTFNSYLSLMANYGELIKEYKECTNSNTNLTDHLNSCLDLDKNSGYYINIIDGENVRRCFYPEKFYEMCFR